MTRVIKLFISMLALILTAQLIPGISIANLGAGLWAALILGLVNTFIKPILTLFTLPLTILSFGFFLVLINGGMLLLTAWLVPGFAVANFLAAILGAILVSILNNLMLKALI
ncbi:phage holin family protein [Natroniella sulfidigena]|uniref:phage holin family protein n=1 Tax=Natroniella sulfidigena TaxID=723921 RepID=UPI002009F017|nr:phage holin family protein [Natroniella sulfidigena]MCK8817210.1 phage holin family protein [Natroniella sulfidigena]